MEKYAVVHGTVPNQFGDVGVVPVQCSDDGTPDPESPYVRFKFHLYPTREEASASLTDSEAAWTQRQKESKALQSLAPLGNNGASNYARPFDKDAQRFWRD